MHNDTHRLGKLVMEVQEYERKEHEKELCLISWVQPMRNSIVLNGVGHSGTATHVCSLFVHDALEKCRCACGTEFLTAK